MLVILKTFIITQFIKQSLCAVVRLFLTTVNCDGIFQTVAIADAMVMMLSHEARMYLKCHGQQTGSRRQVHFNSLKCTRCTYCQCVGCQ